MQAEEKSMPELYQVVGSVLRDIANARFISDLYSRNLSRYYERDALLRSFPVPRAEISEAEVGIKFVFSSVLLAEDRHDTHHFLLSAIFENYSHKIAAFSLEKLRSATNERLQANPSPEDKTRLEQLNVQIGAQGLRDQLEARLIHSFHDYQDVQQNRLIDAGVLNEDEFHKLLADYTSYLFKATGLNDQPLLIQETEVKDSLPASLRQELKEEIKQVFEELQDFKVEVNISPEAIHDAGTEVSTVRIKVALKNYLWQKIDVDETDQRAIRKLVQE